MDLLAQALQPLEPRRLMSTLYWDASPTSGLQGGSGTWSTSALNWSTTPNGQGDRVGWTPGSDAVFSVNASATITLSGAVEAKSITFSGSGYTLTGSTLTLTGNGNITANQSALINNIIDGTAGLTKLGGGTLALGGDNTFTGITSIKAGTLSLLHEDAVNDNINVDGGTLFVGAANGISGSAALTINNGTATLSASSDFTGGVSLKPNGKLNINASGAIGAGTLTITGGTIDNTSGGLVVLATHNPIAWNGNFTFNGSNALGLGNGNVSRNGNRVMTVKASTLSIDGVISGAQGLTKDGNGTLDLGGINTFTGMMTIASGTLVISGKLGNAGVTVAKGALRLENASAISKNTITVSGAQTSVTQTVANAISGTAALVIHNGVVTLSTNNNYTGTTTLDGTGLLQINASGALGSSKLVIGGGTIGNSSGGAVTNLANNSIELKNNFTFNGPNELNLGTGSVTRNGNRTINVASSALAIGGILSGNYTLTKMGPGVLVLNGNNSNTGNTTVSAGTLGGTGSIAAATVANNATISPGSPATGTGILNTKNLTLASGAKFEVQINGGTAGSGYDQLKVTGTVSINGSQLNVVNASGSSIGGSITIIDNDGSDAVVGTFAGLAEGAMLTANGISYSISYVGGTGNDVVLTEGSGFTTVDDFYQILPGHQLVASDVSGSATSANTNDNGLIVNDEANGHTLTISSVKITSNGSATTYTNFVNNLMTLTTPKGGSLQISRFGTFNYTPATGFTGLDGDGTTSNSIDLVYTDGYTPSEPTNLQFFVSNFVPVLETTGTDEGSPTYLMGTLDGSINGPWSVLINWGDNSPAQTVSGNSAGEFSATHIYKDDGTYTATVTATTLGGVGTPTEKTIVIDNVAPTAELTVGPSTISFATATIAVVNATDPSETDTTAGLTYSFDFNNDGDFNDAGEVADSTNASVTYTFITPGSYIFRARVSDKDGGYTDLGQTIEVSGTGAGTTFINGNPLNLEPPVQVKPQGVSDQWSQEGQAGTFTLGSFSDPTPNAGPYTVEVDWGDGTREVFNKDQPGSIGSREHTYPDNGIYNVTVRVENARQIFDGKTFKVTVFNTQPYFVTNDPPSPGYWVTPVPGEPSTPTVDLPITITLDSATDRSSVDLGFGLFYTFSTGTGYRPFQRDASFTFTPTMPGQNTIYWKARDKDGLESDYRSATIFVTDRPTGVWITGEKTVATGTPYVVNVNVHHIDAAWSANKWFINWGDGSQEEVQYIGVGEQPAHTYTKPGSNIIKLRAEDTSTPPATIWNSNELEVDVTPAFPSPELTGNGYANSIELKWDSYEYGTYAEAYYIWMDTPSGKSLVGINRGSLDSINFVGAAKTYTISSLESGKEYKFWVTQHLRGWDSSFRDPITVSTISHSLNATINTQIALTHALRLDWARPDVGVDQFIVEKKTGNTWSLIKDSIPSTATSVVIDELDYGTAYTLRVVGTAGSNRITVSDDLTKTTLGYATVPYVASSTMDTFSNTLYIGGQIVGYPAHGAVQLHVKANDNDLYELSTSVLPGDNWSTMLGGIIPGTTYDIGVRAWDSTAMSPFYNASIVADYSGASGWPGSGTPLDVEPYVTVNTVSATQKSYTLGGDVASAYYKGLYFQEFRWSETTQSWESTYSNVFWGSNITMSGGSHDVGTYRVVVQNKYKNGSTYWAGAYWTEDYTITDAAPTPTGLHASTVGPHKLEVKWNSIVPSGQTENITYELQRSSDGGASFSKTHTVTNSQPGVITFEDDGLNPGVNYIYRVAAKRSSGSFSPFSSNSAAKRTSWIVGVEAVPGKVAEGGQGEFNFYRIGMVDAQLQIEFDLNGSATNGTDYKHNGGDVPDSQTFTQGRAIIAYDPNITSSTGLGFNAVDDTDNTEFEEDIILILGDGYATATPPWARDSATAPYLENTTEPWLMDQQWARHGYEDRVVIPDLFDVDVDSDNDDGISAPERSDSEDSVEMTAPGKYLNVNSGDSDRDGIPNYADGYDQVGDKMTTDGFVPLVIALPSYATMTNVVSVKIDYKQSKPVNVRSGSGTEQDPYVYNPEGGYLRLWTNDRENGAITRTASNAKSMVLADPSNATKGYFVESDTYEGEDFKKLGLFHEANDRQITLWVEAVRKSTELSDLQVAVTVKFKEGTTRPNSYQAPNGYPTSETTDTVQFSFVQPRVTIDSDNTSAGDPETNSPLQDQSKFEEGKPGKIILVDDVYRDTNNNGTPDFYDRSRNFTTTGLVPVKFTIPGGTNLENAKVKFDYRVYVRANQAFPAQYSLQDGYADPTGTGDVEIGTGTKGYVVVPGNGALRLWDADGFPINGTYDADDIFGASTSSERTATLYLEAVRATLPDKPAHITLWFSSDGDDFQASMSDSVNVTAVQDYADSASTSGAVRLADGSIWLSNTDFMANGWDVPWSNTHVITTAARPGLPNTYGNGVTIAEMPRLIQSTGAVIAIIGGDTIYFDRTDPTDAQSPTYKYEARFGRTELLSVFWEQGSAYPRYVMTLPNGGQYKFLSFNPSNSELERGGFDSYTGPSGTLTSAHYSSDGKIDTIIQGGVSIDYRYYEDANDPNLGKLKSIVWRSTTDQVLKTIQYEYYEGKDLPGGIPEQGVKGDLKRVLVRQGDENAVIVDGAYYRYAPIFGPAHVTMAFVGEDFLRLKARLPNYATESSDYKLLPYRSVGFRYYNDGRVYSQWVQGAGNDLQPSADIDKIVSGQFNYTYSAAHPYTSGQTNSTVIGSNAWSLKATVTRMDTSYWNPNKNPIETAAITDSKTTLYLNYAGQELLSKADVHQQVGGDAKQIATFTQYDNQGRMTMVAAPSAVKTLTESTIEGRLDLLGRDTNGNYIDIEDSSGLISKYVYYTKAEHSASTPKGFLKETFLARGDTTLGVRQNLLTYKDVTTATSNPDPAVVIYMVASEKIYSKENTGTNTLGEAETLYVYSDWVRFLPRTIVVKPPIVSSAQNGSGTFEPVTTKYDDFGNVTSVVVGSNTTKYEYSNRGLLEKTRVDPNGLNLTTNILERDAWGRVTKIQNPNQAGSTTRYTQYKYFEYENGSKVETWPEVGPVLVTRTNYATNSILSYALNPSNNDLLAGSITTTDAAGRPVYVDRYFSFAGLGNPNLVSFADGGNRGIKDSNYYRTELYYDVLGRQNQTKDAVGVFTKTYFNALGLDVSQVVQPANSGEIEIARKEYDKDSNLKKYIIKPGASANDRVTDFYYDWRNRLVATNDTIRIIYNTYDNLDRVITQSVYDVAKGAGISASSNGIPDKPSANLRALRAFTMTDYDDRGRVFQKTAFSVDPPTTVNGIAIGGIEPPSLIITNRNGLKNQTFYDDAGRVRKTIGTTGLVRTNQFDGAGRLKQHTAGVSETNFVSKTEMTYDANGNEILTVQTDTGPVGNRVSYVAKYFDGADRLTDVVNYGTNAPAGGVRPATIVQATTNTGSRPGWSPSATGQDPYLLTSYRYDAAGNVQFTVDPRGIITKQFFDRVSRVTKRIEAYVGNDVISGNGQNRITTYKYDGLDRTLEMASVHDNPANKDETTKYTYGQDARFLTRIEYPGAGIPAPGAQGAVTLAPYFEKFEYNQIGEVIKHHYRNQSVHQLTYDAQGKMINDLVISKGQALGAFEQMNFEYDVLGNLVRTGYSPFTAIFTRLYNGFGQVTAEIQSWVPNHLDPYQNIDPTTTVQYAYTDAASGSQLGSITYPKSGTNPATIVDYNRNITDSALGRVTEISVGTQTLETYQYLGLSNIVAKLHPEISLDLFYYSTDSTSGYAAGIDPFGRIAQQRYARNVNQTIQRQLYTYDADSNITEKRVLVSDPNGAGGVSLAGERTSELFYAHGVAMGAAYDSLGRLNNWRRGKKTELQANANAPHVDYPRNDLGEIQNSQLPAPQIDPTYYVPVYNDEPGKKVGFRFDSWDRVVGANIEYVGTTKKTSRAYIYDPLNRYIGASDFNTELKSAFWNTYNVSGGDVKMFTSLAGQVLVERVVSEAGNHFEYIYGVDGQLIMRDQRAGSLAIPGGTLEDRVYALSDAKGNVTTIVGRSGNVRERFIYDPLGKRTVLNADFTAGVDYYNFSYRSPTRRFDDASGMELTLNGNAYNSFRGANVAPDYMAIWWSSHPNAFNGEVHDTLYYYPGEVWKQTKKVIGGMIEGMLHPIDTYNTLVDNTATIISRAMESGDSTFSAALQGLAYEVCTLVGVTPVLESIAGVDIITGEELSWEDRTERGALGIFQLATTAMGAAKNYSPCARSFRIDAGKCFAAGTQVVVGAQMEFGDQLVEVRTQEQLQRLRTQLGHDTAIATAPRIVAYITQPIESLNPGDSVLACDENEADGELVIRRIEECFKRETLQLLHLTLRSSSGIEQTLRTTFEHPVYKLGLGWVASGELEAGDSILEAGGGLATVIAVSRQRLDQVIDVFNFRVAEAHTYFVRAENSEAEPVWVHNSLYGKELSAKLRAEANDTLSSKGSKVHSNVPEWFEKDPARGILRAADTEVPLRSGAAGPGGKYLGDLTGGKGSGLNAMIPTHVEGHVAGLFHKYKLSYGELFINKPPCGTGAMCRYNLGKILPKNAVLDVHFLDNTGGVSTWRFTGGSSKWEVIRGVTK